MTSAKMDLYDRLVEVLGSFNVHPEERRLILEATGNADSWDQVPEDVKQLIVKIENSPRESWDDPADLPDQQNL